jgi:DNA replicative helicase MCM subunit Mcm2 (Cdc46/Mcm family)
MSRIKTFGGFVYYCSECKHHECVDYSCSVPIKSVRECDDCGEYAKLLRLLGDKDMVEKKSNPVERIEGMVEVNYEYN